jgi:hypothetical protein
MSPNQTIYLLVAHFISHYLLQVDAMSVLKSKHFSWLVLHSILYLVSLFFIMLLGILWFDSWRVQSILEFCFLVGLAHFVISYIMTNANAENKERKQYYLALIGAGFEQLLYATILIYLSYYLI